MKTLDYILIENPNGDLQQTELVATDEYRLNSKINLIPYNQVDGLEWRRPTLPQIRAFQKKVEQGKAPKVTLRMEKGHDIEAACGQLRLQESSNLS